MESKNNINNTDKLSIRMLKTEYAILQKLNLDTDINYIRKTIEKEESKIRHSILILDFPKKVEVYHYFTPHIQDFITIKNITEEDSHE